MVFWQCKKNNNINNFISFKSCTNAPATTMSDVGPSDEDEEEESGKRGVRGWCWQWREGRKRSWMMARPPPPLSSCSRSPSGCSSPPRMLYSPFKNQPHVALYNWYSPVLFKHPKDRLLRIKVRIMCNQSVIRDCFDIKRITY